MNLAARCPMLSALLLDGLFAAPIATVSLFVAASRPAQRAKAGSRWAARSAITVLAAIALIAVVLGILALIGVTTGNLVASGIGLAVASVVWLPVRRRWNAAAHLCWATTTFLFVTYLAFMLWWTFASHLGAAGTAGGLLLWVLELVAAALGCAYLWEMCDALGRDSWVRRVDAEELANSPDGPFPFVCLQIPCYNEPPEMVIETLKSLQALDYPNYEVQVIDDNTEDEAMWQPVAAWCAEHGAKFVHLSDWPGYKSGALNYAVENMVDERCELIGVVDSDYQIDPQFLRRCAPLFADQRVGFIQTPQDYRDWEDAGYYRRLYYSYQYFFAVSQPSRNERDGAIFAGTMGLIRRSALQAVGGWDEWCITEDAEISLRLLRAGWSGLHVDTSFGKGIMPLTFEALKGQRFRWCFGGIQILRRHWRSMLPGRKTDDNHLSTAQRWAYLAGAVQWYGDLLALVFFVFLLVGAANMAFGYGLLYRKLTGFLLGAIPVLVALGLLRAVALLRRGTGASWREAFGAFFIWQATSLTVARASVQALFAKEAEFLRTPKTQGESAWGDALKANWAEGLLGALGVAAIAGALINGSSYGAPLLAALLLWPTSSFLAALYNSLSAQRASLPADLRERRRTEHLRYGARRLGYAAGGLGLAGAATALAIGLFAPGTTTVAPQLVGPAQGLPVHYGPAPASPRRPSRSGVAAQGQTTRSTPTTTSPRRTARGATSTATTGSTTGPGTTPTTGTTGSTTGTTPTTASTPSTTATTPTNATTGSTTGTSPSARRRTRSTTTTTATTTTSPATTT